MAAMSQQVFFALGGHGKDFFFHVFVAGSAHEREGGFFAQLDAGLVVGVDVEEGAHVADSDFVHVKKLADGGGGDAREDDSGGGAVGLHEGVFGGEFFTVDQVLEVGVG